MMAVVVDHAASLVTSIFQAFPNESAAKTLLFEQFNQLLITFALFYKTNVHFLSSLSAPVLDSITMQVMLAHQLTLIQTTLRLLSCAAHNIAAVVLLLFQF